MMKPVERIPGADGDPCTGQIRLNWKKTLWIASMLLPALILGPITWSWDAFLLFLVLTYFLLLTGHSVGMHRLMIHKTFSCSKPVERVLIYLGVLVGMAGPYGIVKIHDLRDWAQRRSACHDFFSHKRNYWLDLWWQLTSTFAFKRAPTIVLEKNLAEDRFYQFLDKTWPLHQLLLAIPLYYLGGLGYVIWGVCARVAVSIIGHWTITYYCHNPGPGSWYVKGAGVQASNLPGLGWITFGECWHNNHHAFPESARIGLEENQPDPAWRLIQLLGKLGLVHSIGKPREFAQCDDLECVEAIESSESRRVV